MDSIEVGHCCMKVNSLQVVPIDSDCEIRTYGPPGSSHLMTRERPRCAKKYLGESAHLLLHNIEGVAILQLQRGRRGVEAHTLTVEHQSKASCINTGALTEGVQHALHRGMSLDFKVNLRQ